MRRLFRELRRREVFRTAGLYVGVTWILIEVASVFLPAFGSENWVLQGLTIAAVIGLPVVIILAWVYDVTDQGIEVQLDPTDTVVVPFGGRRTDFVVIAVLAIALVISIYLNVADDGDMEIVEIEPLSILIADFDNKTGDNLFDGSLELPLRIGLESASFISVYRRDAARRAISVVPIPGDDLNVATALQVSMRENIRRVLAGSIEEDNGRYLLSIRVIDSMTGDTLMDAEDNARDKLDVLAAVGRLAGDLREKFGDETSYDDIQSSAVIFTARNIEAARAYSTGQSSRYSGNHDEAIHFYEKALEHDPDFGLAYSGLALSAGELGKMDEAAKFWESALSSLDSVTNRERLRTQGWYYSIAAHDVQKAIEVYERLVESYPADGEAHHDLALQYFYALDFKSALKENVALLEIYPNSVKGRINQAKYLLYATEIDEAVVAAEALRESVPDEVMAWLPIAMLALVDDEPEVSKSAYEQMAAMSARGESTALLGLADIAIYLGNFKEAVELLLTATAGEYSAVNEHYRSSQYVALAEVYLSTGNTDAAIAAVETGLNMSSRQSTLVQAALIYLTSGKIEKAQVISNTLRDDPHIQANAYAALIESLIEQNAGNNKEAIDLIAGGIEVADLWLLRFHIGRMYLEAGYVAEALDAFAACKDREGEVTSAFFDGIPTYRYAADLQYWRARTQEELGMQDAAQENYRQFTERRPPGDSLAEDARQRLR